MDINTLTRQDYIDMRRSMSQKISPITVQLCVYCMQPWQAHVDRARLLATVELEDDDVPAFPSAKDIEYHLTPYLCIELLRAANQGPMGPPGPQGAAGMNS